MPVPGAYRELFRRGLKKLVESNELTAQDKQDAEHYLNLLDDPSYKFMKEIRSGGDRYWRSGELFMSS